MGRWVMQFARSIAGLGQDRAVRARDNGADGHFPTGGRRMGLRKSQIHRVRTVRRNRGYPITFSAINAMVLFNICQTIPGQMLPVVARSQLRASPSMTNDAWIGHG